MTHITCWLPLILLGDRQCSSLPTLLDVYCCCLLLMFSTEFFFGSIKSWGFPFHFSCTPLNSQNKPLLPDLFIFKNFKEFSTTTGLQALLLLMIYWRGEEERKRVSKMQVKFCRQEYSYKMWACRFCLSVYARKYKVRNRYCFYKRDMPVFP